MQTPQNWSAARLTLIVAIVTASLWAIQAGLGIGDIAAVWGGFIPVRVSGLPGDEALAPWYITPLTATLIHGGAVHLLSNMLILLFCGRAVEAIIGMRQFVILYIIGAFAAAAVHYLGAPADRTPMIGASGAISAVLGTYSMMFGRNRVKVANPTLALWLNSLWLGAAWIVLQLIVGFTFDTVGARIAIGAHIGGFLAGLLLAKPLLLLRYRKA